MCTAPTNHTATAYREGLETQLQIHSENHLVHKLLNFEIVSMHVYMQSVYL